MRKQLKNLTHIYIYIEENLTVSYMAPPQENPFIFIYFQKCPSLLHEKHAHQIRLQPKCCGVLSPTKYYATSWSDATIRLLLNSLYSLLPSSVHVQHCSYGVLTQYSMIRHYCYSLKKLPQSSLLLKITMIAIFKPS